MRFIEIITEAVAFKSESLDYHHGQHDMRLTAYDSGIEVGHIDYSVYQDEPSIQMIEVPKHKRRGYATALLQELQRQHPGIEIAWGMLTPDGTQLYKAVPKTVIQNADVQAKMALLKHKQEEVIRLESLANDSDQPIPAPLLQHWNDLNDDVWQLEQDLRDAKPTMTLIASG